jgi:23S rRNA (pseudouridine1915-N3)-methyltransferase
MGLLLLFVGKTREGFIQQGIEKYQSLLRPHLQVEIRILKGAKARDNVARSLAVEEEADSILGRIQPADYLVALDERGTNPDSVVLARELEKLFGSGRRVVFAVGGPFGLSERVRARADRVLSLSKLTFTHEMARLILLEQLYRAVTIMKHKTYHY